MNREAAALGVPVYSIFRGKTGAVDRRLEQEGRLIMVRTSAEVHSKIIFERRQKQSAVAAEQRPALLEIVNHVEEIIRSEYSNGSTERASHNSKLPV